MTRIRLKRIGAKGQPYYRIVVADQRSPRDGRVIEEIGWYDPRSTDKETGITLKVDRAQYWVSKGAKPSEPVRWILEGKDVLKKTVYKDVSKKAVK